MLAEPIGPHMTATPDRGGWTVEIPRGLTIGRVMAGLDRYAFFPVQCGLDADELRVIADFLDRVTAARKAGGGT